MTDILILASFSNRFRPSAWSSSWSSSPPGLKNMKIFNVIIFLTTNNISLKLAEDTSDILECIKKKIKMYNKKLFDDPLKEI